MKQCNYNINDPTGVITMKVRCVTDGKEFSSMSEADKFYEFYDGRVSELCKSENSYKGLSFQKISGINSTAPNTHRIALDIEDKRDYDNFTRVNNMRCGDCFLDEKNTLHMFVEFKIPGQLHCINLKTRRFRIIKLEPDSFLNKVNYKIVLND